MDKRPPADNWGKPWQPTRDGPKGLLDRLANAPPDLMTRAIAKVQADENAYVDRLKAEPVKSPSSSTKDSYLDDRVLGVKRGDTWTGAVEEGGESVTDPTFADKLRFFDVEGTPVAIMPTPDGGFDVRAFDGPESRRFSLSSLLRNGGEIDEAAFERLKVFGVNYLDRSATIILAGVMGFDSTISSGCPWP